MTGFYVYAASTHCTSLYPDNRPANFTIKLPPKIALDGSWEIGLVDVKLAKAKGASRRSLLIACNICDNSYINGRSLGVLRSVNLSSNYQEFANIQYSRVQPRSDCNDIAFSILESENLGEASLLAKPTWLTVHFRRLE